MRTAGKTNENAGQLLTSEQSPTPKPLSLQENTSDLLLTSEQSPMETSPQPLSGESWIGRQQAFAMIASKCSEHQALCLKQLKQDRVCDSLNLTWEQFCERH